MKLAILAGHSMPPVQQHIAIYPYGEPTRNIFHASWMTFLTIYSWWTWLRCLLMTCPCIKQVSEGNTLQDFQLSVCKLKAVSCSSLEVIKPNFAHSPTIGWLITCVIPREIFYFSLVFLLFFHLHPVPTLAIWHTIIAKYRKLDLFLTYTSWNLVFNEQFENRPDLIDQVHCWKSHI